VVSSSWTPKTAVCVIRVEERQPGRPVITVTATLDVEVKPPGEARTVSDCRRALRLVDEFLRGYGACGEPRSEDEQPDSS
jgi:hypothetical protein